MPNHHFAAHVAAQLEEYATVYEMWAFFGERQNKWMKNTNLNNCRGGQLEVTMMRENQRENQLGSMVEYVASDKMGTSQEAKVSRAIAKRFLHQPWEARGMVEAMSSESNSDATSDTSDSISADAWVMAACHSAPVGLGEKIGKPFVLERSFRDEVIKHYNSRSSGRNQPAQPKLYQVYDPSAPQHTATYLNSSVQALSCVILNGCRITPHSSSGTVKACLGSFAYPAGEVLRLLLHEQIGYPPQVFAEMTWMQPARIEELEGANTPWHDYPELEIRPWVLCKFANAGAPTTPPTLIPIDAIQCQLG
ncbi:hypothetical protein C8T65DRAFT_738286 [Cerioporus squamosus]|nr:hypothetical protein C8T65DRAFT_738286 [Cerioporus squamosus]